MLAHRCTRVVAQVGKYIPTVAGLTQVIWFGVALRCRCSAIGGSRIHLVTEVEAGVCEVGRDTEVICVCLWQGEVVTLANKALQSLCARGTNVLLEGRSQTVNYIRHVPQAAMCVAVLDEAPPLDAACSRVVGRSVVYVVVLVCRSPHRFELVLKDPQVIGMRRTAQVLMGRALQLLGDDRDVKAALWSALAALASENNVISLAQLRKADSQTTAAIIRGFGEDAVFREVGRSMPFACLHLQLVGFNLYLVPCNL